MAENDNKYIAKSRDFFDKLNIYQKVLLLSIPVVVSLAIVLLLLNMKSTSLETLYSNIEQQEAAKIVEYLKTNNIKYELSDNGSTIKVEKDRVLDTRLSLAQEGLPSSGVLGYELFDRTNLGMSEFVQKLNYKRALEGELAKTINTLEEVKNSRVHLVIPEKTLFEKDQQKPTASVTIHLHKDKHITPKSISGIQTLVAKSVEGMIPEDVSVIDHKGKLLSDSPIDINSVAGLTSQQLDQQKKLEDYLTNKVQSLLDNVIGRDNSSLRVNAELDFTKIEQTKKDYDPDRQVVRSEQQIAESNKSTDSLSYPAVSMDKQETNVIQNYEISENFEHIIHSVGNIKRLSVAAMINGTTKVVDSNGVKQMVYVPRTEDEVNKLTEIIKNAVGFDVLRKDQISVINVPFDTINDFESVGELNKPVWYNQPDNQRLFLLILAILIAIFMMYRMMQSKQLKERVRIAMELPQNIEIKEEEEEDYDDDEPLEDLDLDQSELLLLPTELPEQLLLEADTENKELEDRPELLEDVTLDKRSLAEKARAKLEESENTEMTEDALLKLEMKNRVEEYMDEKPEIAVKILRLFMSADAS
ncbi:MAG TPA: flagellar basal-body MS-ring/collar protein FliF [Candidatus Kapabacteria bacterium]|nr:flagellar basal-body MS-ring/collar protein FliF [Candidatus Kapabacteria bacterium]